MATGIPDMQRAWVIIRKGRPAEALKLVDTWPVPKKLRRGEILVKVKAAAYNPVGNGMMGLLPNFIARRPHVSEHDFAGEIVDANGTEFENGQEVYGWIPLPLKISSKQGTLCEYTRVPAQLIRPKPPQLKPTEAAGLGLVGATVYRALFYNLKLKQGQSLFINGGSTSVGIFAIQIAKSLGCTVTVSASGKREEFMRSLGVDKFIDYTKGPVYEQLTKDPPSPKFDAFLEAVGSSDPQFYLHSDTYMVPGGQFASVGPRPNIGGGYSGLARLFLAMVWPKILGGVTARWSLISVDDRPDEFKEFGKYVDEGKIKPVIDSVFAFEEVLKAYEQIMSWRACGKIVVRVDPTVE